MIQVANSPCSWGALEFDFGSEKKSLGYEQVLREMAETGYAGTELGDWGFMPTDASELKTVLAQKKLQLLGAFVPIAMADSKAHASGMELSLKIAKLMYKAGYQDSFVILADQNGSVKERTINAGRISSEMALNDEKWKIYAEGTQKIAKAVREKYGMRTIFHHHCGGYIETPAEVSKLMKLTDPSLLGLCLDTGHYAFGGGDPVEALKKYNGRVWHVHFKDYDLNVGRAAINKKYDYFKALEEGVFCELGKGNVNFQLIVKLLNEKAYKGWIVVEQDILPGMGSPKECAAKNREFIRSLGL